MGFTGAFRADRQLVVGVGGRKGCPFVQARHRDRIERFDKRDTVVPFGGIAADTAHHDNGQFRISECFENTVDVFVGRRHVACGRVPFRRREIDVALDLAFLHADVETDIYRSVGRRLGDLPGAQHRFHGRLGGTGRVVPFDVIANDRCLVRRRVNPFDPGAADMGVERPGGAKYQHRVAFAPGIEDRHAGMHQSDIRMQRDGHRPVGDLGIAVGDGDAVFLVQADNHLRFGIAEIIDDAVVETAETGARHQCNIIDADGPYGFGDGIAAPAELRITNAVRTVNFCRHFFILPLIIREPRMRYTRMP